MVVHNLFGNLPVRFKNLALRYESQEAEEKVFGELKRRIVGYLLASPVDIHLSYIGRKLKYTHRCRPSNTRTASFDINLIKHVFVQAGLSAKDDTWKLASAKVSGFSIRVAICLTPSPTKHDQVIALGRVPIGNHRSGHMLYDEVNSIFDASEFGMVEEESGASRPNSRQVPEYKQASLRGRLVKGVDRWPRFYIRIDAKTDTTLDRNISNDLGREDTPPAMQHILHLLRSLMIQFLQSQSFKPRRRQVAFNATTRSPVRLSTASHASPFDAWKALKPSTGVKRSTAGGLPFAIDETNEISDLVLSEDVRLLLRDIEVDPEANHEANASISHHFAEDHGHHILSDADVDDLATTWTDPQTGQRMRVNPENGFIVPFHHHKVPSRFLDDPAKSPPLLPPQYAGRRHTSAPVADVLETLQNWPTMTFQHDQEPAITSLAHGNLDNGVRGEINVYGTAENLHARQLASATILGQIDAKFILATLPSSGGLVVALIDQHAADERVKVEEMYRHLCSPNPIPLMRPIKFELSPEEVVRFDRRQADFARWGLIYSIGNSTDDESSLITVTHLPSLVAERCRVDPKILIELLRKEIWSASRQSATTEPDSGSGWVARMSRCPQGLTELANSRACRTAIMFSDVLSQSQCLTLVQQLSECTLPFQCAHGRPSIIVLASVGNLGLGQGFEVPDFGEAYRSWA